MLNGFKETHSVSLNQFACCPLVSWDQFYLDPCKFNRPLSQLTMECLLEGEQDSIGRPAGEIKTEVMELLQTS